MICANPSRTVPLAESIGFQIAGFGPYRNFENQKFNVQQIDTNDLTSSTNSPAFFGSNTPASDITGSPVTNRPFYGLWTVLVGKDSSGVPHFYTIRIVETHPSYAGDIWSATYNAANKTWGEWRNIKGV